MSQIVLPLDARPEALLQPSDEAAQRVPHPVERQGLSALWSGGLADAFEAEGYRIGWEHARYQATPPADHLHAGHPVRLGWEAGRTAFGGRTLALTRAARMWLDLRLQAWLRGRAFDDVMVTPRLVAQIDVPHCPVTGVALTTTHPGQPQPTDAVVMPLYEGAACAAGNLAVVSRQVALARAALSRQEMLATARQLEVAAAPPAAPKARVVSKAPNCAPAAAAVPDVVAGLDAAAWRRLAALTSLATPLAHAEAAAQPLLVLPPARVRLLNPVQALQALLTVLFTRPAYARQLTDLGALMPNAQARRAYFLFMNAMLARRLSARGAVPHEQVRTALQQAWSHPLVQQRWHAFVQLLSPVQAERVVRLAVQRSEREPGGVWRWTGAVNATEGWALGAGGRAGSVDDGSERGPEGRPDAEPENELAAGAVQRGVQPAAPLNAPAAAPASGPARSGVRRPSAAGVVPRGASGRPTAPSRRPARGTA